MAQKDTFGLGPLDRIISEYQQNATAPGIGQAHNQSDDGEPIQPGNNPTAEIDTRQPAAPRAGRGSLLPPPTFVPVFEAAALKYDVPVNVLMALAQQESGYDPLIRGHEMTKWGRAQGLMQYLPSTAKMLGINPYDARQAIDAAARQIRERLDKGYSIDDAVKEHFAGPDRRLWGPKTAQYGVDVLGKARRIGAAMYGGEQQSADLGADGPVDPAITQGPMSTRQDGPMSVPAGTDTRRLNLTAAEPEPDEKERPSIFDQAMNDWSRGVSNLKNIAIGIGALGADLFGADETADGLLKTYVENSAKLAKENPAVIGTYKNVHSLGDAGRYAVEAVAENLPMMIPSLLSGGVGALAARKIAERGVASYIEKQVASGVARSVAEKQAAVLASRRVLQGTAAGAASSSIGIESGNIYGDTFKDTGKKAAGLSLAFGVPAGLLDAIEPVYALSKVMGPAVKELAGGIIKRMGKEAGKQFLIEAGTEGLQSMLENAPKSIATGEPYWTEDLLDDVIDSVLKGGVAGGVIGGTSTGARGAYDAMRGDAGATTSTDGNVTVHVPNEGKTGPIGRALQAGNDNADARRVVVTTQDGQTLTGFLDGYQDDGQGGFSARVLGDDGRPYQFSSADGVSITPERSGTPALPPPTITVDPAGNAATTEQRQSRAEAEQAAREENRQRREQLGLSPDVDRVVQAHKARTSLPDTVEPGTPVDVITRDGEVVNGTAGEYTRTEDGARLTLTDQNGESRQFTEADISEVIPQEPNNADSDVAGLDDGRSASGNKPAKGQRNKPKRGKKGDAGAAPAPQQAGAAAEKPVESAAQGVADATGPADQQPALSEPKDLSSMSLDELVAHRKFLSEQARGNRGWDKPLLAEKRKVERAINAIDPAALEPFTTSFDGPQPISPDVVGTPAEVTTPEGKPLLAFDMPDGDRVLVRQDHFEDGRAKLPAFTKTGHRRTGPRTNIMRTSLRAPRTEEPAAVSAATSGSKTEPIKVTSGLKPTEAPQATNPQTELDAARTAWGESHSEANRERLRAARAAVEAEAPARSETQQPERKANRPKTISKEDAEHLFGVDQKREKALERIAKGRAWFSDQKKAQAFITKNGLKDTHEVEQTGAKRFEAKAKDQQAATGDDAGATVATTRPEPADTSDEKSKWIKATVDRSRLNGSDGIQLSVNDAGEPVFLGDPNSNKDGRALLATYEKALEAGATKREIADAIRAATQTAPADAGDTAQQVQDFIDGKRDTPPELPSVAQAEPNLEAARKLLKEQKDATGNKKAEANVKRKIRALAKKTPITDERTVLALDMAATRLGMEDLAFAEAAPADAGETFERGGREWSAEARPGKGLIKGKFLPYLNGESTPGGPFDTAEAAIEHAKSYAGNVLEGEANAQRDQARMQTVRGKVERGEALNKPDLDFLNLREGYSDLRWFIPNAARLFGLTSRKVRPLVSDLIRVSHNDMGTKFESVPTNRALQQMANALRDEAAPSAGTHRQMGPNGFTFLADDQASAIQSAFSGTEVESLPIGRAGDGYLNFGEQFPDGRYRIDSADRVVGFDGKGGWKTVGEKPEQTGSYDVNAEPSSEVIRVLSELGAKKKAPTSAAPEHAQVGVDQRELGQIVDEFNAAQASMQTGDEQIHHLFDAPAKSEVVRLQNKATVYHKDHGWMTPAEARALISKWKDHAAAQGETRQNADKVVLSLFDYTGQWSQPWEDAGYQVFRFDIQNDPEMGDVNNFSTGFFNDWFGDFDGQDIYAILAACPCTDFAVSGARHFAAKDKDGRTVASVRLVHQTLAAIEYFKPAVWALENPVGRIEKLGGLPPWRLSFDPNHLGDPYTKKTLLWGRFNADLPVAPVEPTEGSKMHQRYGGRSVATKNARSVTPEGFSYGFFMANNAIDHPQMAVANKYDRLDAKLIGQAVDAGITPKEIDSIVEDFYYQDLDDAGAEQALRAAIADRNGAETAPKQQKKPVSVTKTPGVTTIVIDPSAELEPSPDPVAPVESTVAPEPKPADARFAKNKIFTADKVAAARARLKSKLNQLNSGIDPEVLMDGLTITGAYVEEGVRDFSAYARAMVEDFGDAIKPYLLSFWEGVRNYPGLNAEGMTPADEARAAHAALIQPADVQTEAVGEIVKKPAKRTRKTGAKADMTLTQDWGADHIDGYQDSPDRETGNTTKDAFMKEARSYLSAVSSILTENGYTPHTDKKGRPEKPVHVNEGGVAGSGDISLTLAGPDGVGVYVHIGDTALRGVVPTTTSGVAIMFRAAQNGDKYGVKGANQWAPVDLSAADFAALVDAHVKREAKSNERPATTPDAGFGVQEPSAQGVPANEEPGTTGDLFGQPVERGDELGEGGERAAGVRAGDTGQSGVRGRSGQARAEGRNGAQDGRGSGPVAGARSDTDGGRASRGRADRSPDAGRNDRGQSGLLPAEDGRPLSAPRNYRIQPGEIAREGSWKASAERNVDIVELVKRLESEGRTATPDEKALMTRFTGWGASEVANGIFPDQRGNFKPGWEELGNRLKAALTPEEYANARRSTQYAHYTSEGVIRSIFSGLDRLGFKGGEVMEPGMGIGLFNGLMPDAMAANSTYTGIEFDAITGAIAKHLYPASNVIVGDFTRTNLPGNYFDAAIGNPPFSSTVISNDPEYKRHRFMLHDYFFAKTIDRVRPGGLVVFVTSKGTMDKASDKARKYLAERANLIGAVRLPQTAFKGNAGTEVVTDVLFLQKRGPGIEDNGVSWLGLKEVKTNKGESTPVNEYFSDHPEMVLGEHAMTGSMYRANEYTVEPRTGEDIEQAFAKAVERLPEAIYNPERGSKADTAKVIERDYNPTNRKEGGLYLSEDGTLMHVDAGSGVPLTQRKNAAGKLIDLRPAQVEWLKGYIGVRDALKQTQYDQLHDGDWQASMQALNDAYDAFVKKHGQILAHSVIERENADGTTSVSQRFKNRALWEMDAEGALVHALEIIQPDGGIIKAPVFSERVLRKPAEPEIKTTQDAMFVSLNRLGRLDIDDVAKLAGLPRDEVIDSLGTSIYEAPGDGWQMADEYLSGNVVRKLEQARAAADLNPKYKRNVDALLAVQPRPLGPTDITVRLGANWLPTTDVEAFAQDVIGERIDVIYTPITGDWSAVGRGGEVAGSEWTAGDMSASKILHSVLNSRQIKVTYKDGEGKTHTDPVATEKANDVARKMKEAFARWIWTDPDRADRLTKYYNEHFNNITPRQYDGSHLTLPGVSSRFTLHPHQKRAVWRQIQDGDTYLAHAVGSGKTIEMIAGGMEQRRLGLIEKPVYTVPNHMLEQFASEFLELYPTAHIMVADEQNFHTSNRRRFLAQAALNNPDAIIITHSAFGRLGMSDEYAHAFIQRQIDEWKAALNDVDGADRITKKQIERRIEQLERRLEGKQGKEAKDRLLTFEELGADYLFVDEMHEFRKLDFATNQGNIKGVDPAGSQRALDLFMKVEYLRGKKPGRSITGASGTPITNTMGELFTVQRFFQPEQLAEDGLSTFDAWAAQYGDTVTSLEQNAAGGYETVTRFAKFQNVPELMHRVRSFMDIVTNSKLGELVKRPNVRGGARQIVVTPSPAGYKAYQKTLEERIKAIRARTGPPEKGQDIILNVISDGRFSALDMRFVDPSLPPDPDSKVNRVVDDLIEAYRATADYEYSTDGVPDPIKGSTILVFSDYGFGDQAAARRGFSMRKWIEQRLAEAGIPREHVAFMRDYKQHAKKGRLFADMREGKKRILIGGKDMETGVNVQKRLTHLFHLDAPWFPSSIEQREGRGVRQGNQNDEVDIRAYATKGSYDSTMWSMNARKARFIEQAMNGDDSVRSLEDVSEASSFEMAAALASGDERYLKLAGLRGDVERLGRLRQAHYDGQSKMRRDRHWAESEIERKTKQAGEYKAAIAKRTPIVAGEFEAKVGKTTFDSREAFSNALFDAFKKLVAEQSEETTVMGQIGGFDIRFDGFRGEKSYMADVHVEVPGSDPILSFPIEEGMAINGLAAKAANQVNGLDRRATMAEQDIANAKRRIEQIDARFGAPFAEEADLLDKIAQLNDLETELAAESKEADSAQVAQQAQAEPPSDVKMSVTVESGAMDASPRGMTGLEQQTPLTIRSTAAERGMDTKTLRDQVFAGLRDASLHHPDVGNIAIGRRGWSKSRANASDTAKLLTVPHLSEIIEGGAYIGSQPAGKGKSGAYHYIARRVNVDGVPLTVLVTVEERPSGALSYYNHSVLNDNFEAAQSGPVDSLLAARRRPTFTPSGPLTRAQARPVAHRAVHDALRQGPLGAVVERLIGSGHVVLHMSQDTMPASTVLEKGTALQGFTKNGVVHLAGESLTPQTAMPVLLHEIFHAKGEALIGTPKWNNLNRRLNRLYEAAKRRKAEGRIKDGDFWDGALRRIEAAERGGSLNAGAAEEFGAYAIENYDLAPSGIKKWVDNFIGMIKDWLFRRFGIQAGEVTPAQLRAMAVAALRAAAGTAPQISPSLGGMAMNEGAMSVEDRYFVNEIMGELAANDQYFRYPASTAHALSKVIADVGRGDIKYVGEEPIIESDREENNGAERRHLMRTDKGHDIFVYENGEDVWLDVSRLDEGEGGSLPYAAVANYAFNTGKTFIGDPAGLSDAALYRRSEAMLNSALRFGTTRHLEPHEYQLRGNPKLGVPPLKWHNDDAENVRSLIDVVTQTVENNVPESKDAYFDFRTGTFRTSEGQPLTDSVVRGWMSSGRSGASGIGRSSIKRAALYRSISRAESGERPGLLELVLRRGPALVEPGSPLNRVAYSTREREQAVGEATAALDADTHINPDEIGGLQEFAGAAIRDMDSRYMKYVAHPRHIAALFKDFTPVFQTANHQQQARNEILEALHKDYTAYDDLTEDAKGRVNQILELGRLTGNVYRDGELKAGVKNPGYTYTVVRDERGEPHRVRQPFEAALTKAGDAVKLSDAEIDAYRHLRTMFDAALDRFRDQAMKDFGLGAYVGRDDPLKAMRDSIKGQPENSAEVRRMKNAIQFVEDIEQSKRTGYVPFSRYGDYVIAVKERVHDIRYVRDGESFLVRNLPEGLEEAIDRIGGVYDQDAKAWIVTPEQRADLERENERTVYSEKVETGLRDKFGRNAERKVRARERDVTQIPSVREAIKRIEEKYVDGNGARRIVSFETTKKRGEGGIDLTALDALAEVAQIDNPTWDAVRAELQKALQAGGFRKHFFQSSHVPGYTPDFQRAMADYMVGMAGYLARRQHNDAWEKNIAAIKGGKLHEYATKYRTYFNDPHEEFAALRQAAFVWKIGANVSSAFVNLTQTMLTTIPTLNQVAGRGVVAMELTKAARDALAMVSVKAGTNVFDMSKAPADLRAEFTRADAAGLFLPLNSFDLMGQANQRSARARKVQRFGNAATSVISLPFSASERFNRIVAFTAAARIARRKGMAARIRQHFKSDNLAWVTFGKKFETYDFAEWLASETQFQMGKINRPTMMRGAGAAMLQFKSFTLQLLEKMYRDWTLHGTEGKIAVASTLAMLVAFSGLWGVPGGEDLRKLLEFMYKQITNKNIDLKDEMRQAVFAATDNLMITDALSSGMPYHFGVDMSQRVGIGNVLPEQFNKTGVDWLDMLTMVGGPGFDMLVSAPIRATGLVAAGNPQAAVRELAPVWAKNPMQSFQWYTDAVRTKRGDKVLDRAEISGADVGMKALGFQPSRVSRQYEMTSAQYNAQRSADDLKRSLKMRFVQALEKKSANRDAQRADDLQADLTEAMSAIRDYNRDAAPDQRIKMDRNSIRQMVMRERLGGRSSILRTPKASRRGATTRAEAYGLGLRK